MLSFRPWCCIGLQLPTGTTLEIWWDGDKTFYPGKVTGFNNKTSTHTVLYDDGDTADVDLALETYNLTGESKV